MWVRDVMTRRPVTTSEVTPVKSALMLLDQNGITAMPVVDNSGAVVGVVSEADLVRDVLAEDPRSHLLVTVLPHGSRPATVDDVMSRHPVTVHADTDLADAVKLMTSTWVKSLPVVDHSGRVVGIVSRSDVVRAFARADAEIEREVEALFESLGVDWLAEVSEGVVTVDGPVGPKETALAERAAGTVAGVVEVIVQVERMRRG